MNDTVVISLSRFLPDARRIAVFIDADVREYHTGIFAEVFPEFRRIIALMSMGIVVRSIAPYLKDKWVDPAVVVITPDFLYAIPVLGAIMGQTILQKNFPGLDLYR